MGMLLILLLLFSPIVSAESYAVRKIIMQGDVVSIHVGTCFGIEKKKVATAWHVVKDADVLKVKIGDAWVDGKVVRIDKDADLAVVEVDAEVEAAPLAKKLPTHGQKARFVGYPKGVRTEGEGEYVETDHPGQLHVLTKNFGPGGSGSPLYINGVVVGVARAVSVETGTDIYATPVSSLRNLLDQ